MESFSNYFRFKLHVNSRYEIIGLREDTPIIALYLEEGMSYFNDFAKNYFVMNVKSLPGGNWEIIYTTTRFREYLRYFWTHVHQQYCYLIQSSNFYLIYFHFYISEANPIKDIHDPEHIIWKLIILHKQFQFNIEKRYNFFSSYSKGFYCDIIKNTLDPIPKEIKTLQPHSQQQHILLHKLIKYIF